MGGRSRKKKPLPLLDVLSDAEARRVLLELLGRHAELGVEAARIAEAAMRNVSRQVVSDDVSDAILMTSLEDVVARSGRPRHGLYYGGREAARAVLDAALLPFQSNVVSLMAEGRIDAARATVEGVLCGLYCLSLAEEHDVLEIVPDFPCEAAVTTVMQWHEAGGGPLDGAFIAEEVPDWAFFLGDVPHGSR